LLTLSDVALAKELCTNTSVERPADFGLNEALPVDLDPHALADLEWVDCRHLAAFEGHVDEANTYIGVVAALNDGVYVDCNPFILGDPALPALHDLNSIGPHDGPERQS
jgi:hypothetical protein